MLFVGGGRLKATTAQPTSSGPNATPFNAGAICIGTAMGINSHVAGLPYGPAGRMAVTTNTSQPVAYYHAGIGFVSSGRIACDMDGEISHYVRGIPMTKEGRVAIDLPVADQQNDDPEK